jgi:hypothetical protein
MGDLARLTLTSLPVLAIIAVAIIGADHHTH